MSERNKKEQLAQDFREMVGMAEDLGYIFSVDDMFALGYLAGRYSLNRLIDNEEKVTDACKHYDETDDLGLHDTIAETLMDLEVIKSKERI